MTLHLIKLCVGADTVEDLAAWQASGRADWPKKGAPDVAHLTSQIPKRADELTDGGALYWVIKGRIQVRQPLIRIEPAQGREGRKRCALVLSRELILTRPKPHRPFQGWRYLDDAQAPPDIGPFSAGRGEGAESIRAELMELGLL
jgi:hypothetical protein